MGLQAPLSMGFPRQEYWRGLLFPFPRDHPKTGITEPSSLALAGEFFTPEPPGKPHRNFIYLWKRKKFSLQPLAQPSTCSLHSVPLDSFKDWSPYSSFFHFFIKIGISLYMLLLFHSSLSPSLKLLYISLIHGISNSTKWTYLINTNRITDTEIRPVIAEGNEDGGIEMDGEVGISRCKLLYIE